MDDRGDDPRDCDGALQEIDVESLATRPVADQVALLSAVGNETRYRILLFLLEADAPVCGCELEPHLDVGQSTVSQSLTRLHRAGLVTRTKRGRWRYYEPTDRAERLFETVESGTRVERRLHSD